MNDNRTLFTLGLASYCFLVAGLAVLTGCNEYALDTSWRSGNYRLIAIDARKQMSLIDTSDKAWDGIGPTIFSIGADQSRIVVARHPSTSRLLLPEPGIPRA